MGNDEAAAVRHLLVAQPDVAFFYLIYREYNSGSIGDRAFQTLVTDPQTCQTTIQQLCAQQKANYEEEIAEIEALPPEEEPYDPFLPDGCSALLCIVLPDKQHYVQIHRQRWYNQGHTMSDSAHPDIFQVAYYMAKVSQGDYKLYQVKP